MMRATKRTCFGLILLVVLSGASLAQPAPLFVSSETLHLHIRADWQALLEDRSEEAEEFPASLSYIADDGSTVTQEIGVRLRGNFRRQAHICSFPPLRIDIARKEANGTLFQGQDKLKLVTHCRNDRNQFEQYVLLEYLTYRAYNELTPWSFQVRLARITYEDSTGAQTDLTRYGFLIEDNEALAVRNGGTLNTRKGVHQERTDDLMITLLSVFQYMIGNTDWSVPALHNINLFDHPAHSAPIAVPYDFDFSGLIDSPYASPAPSLPIASVRERVYRGFCRSSKELEPILAIFTQHREAIYELFTQTELLKPRYVRRARNYLNGFYATLSAEERIDRAFLKKCRITEE